MERAVLAYFRDLQAAEETRTLLRDRGVRAVQIDRISSLPGEDMPTMEKKGEPSNLSDTADRDIRILVASNPAFGGLTDAVENADGCAILLTAVCPPGRVAEVEQIIRERGGRI